MVTGMYDKMWFFGVDELPFFWDGFYVFEVGLEKSSDSSKGF